MIVLAVAAAAAAAVFLVPRYFGEGADIRAAEESVRDFVGRDLRLEYRGSQTYLGGEQLRFTETTDAGGVDYYVDRETERVTRMDDFTTPAYEVTVDEAAALAAATSFAQAHFASADVADLELVEEQLVDHGRGTAKWFAYTWVDVDPSSGALLPLAVSVCVDPVTGEVFSYTSLDVEVTVATSPEVGREQAERAALDALDGVVRKPDVVSATLAVATDPPDDPTGRQALVWQVVVRGDDRLGYATGAFVYVDAVSGDVLKVDPFA